MRYQFTLIVPADTHKDNPIVQACHLNSGIVTTALIRFRSGCHNRVFVTVNDALFQIVPALGSEGLNGDNQIYTIPLEYPLLSSPYELTLKAWSDGTAYDHEITFSFDLDESIEDSKLKFLQALQAPSEEL